MISVGGHMKQIEFKSIGMVSALKSSSLASKRQLKLELEEIYQKALQQLNLFSHCLVFWITDEGIHMERASITECDQKRGYLNIEINTTWVPTGTLIDIKPYFPCEDQILITNDESKNFNEHNRLQNESVLIAFQNEPIGKFVRYDNLAVLKLSNIASETFQSMAKQVNSGDYLRIFWWFDRFDKAEFRRSTTCNPPYPNSPKCGIFATRSPVRPNPVASTVVKVVAVDIKSQSIEVLGFDGFENSPILQISPYVTDEVVAYRVPKWVEHWTPYKVFQTYESVQISSEHVQAYTNALRTLVESDLYVEALESTASMDSVTDFEKTSIQPSNHIILEGVKTHNLKNISLNIPKEKITTITGVSGSGKSSLAFDTIFAESQKQYMDLLMSNAPSQLSKVHSNVSRIQGLQPAIAIEQKAIGRNPRSTVGTVSKASVFLKQLYVILGERVCPTCQKVIPENLICDDCGTVFFSISTSDFSSNHPEYMCPNCKGLGYDLQIDIDQIISHPERSILDGASDWWGNLRKHREKPNANWMRGEVLALAADLNEDLEVPFKDLSDAFKTQLFYGSNGRIVSLTYENSNGRKGTISRPVEGVVNTIKRLLNENKADKGTRHLDRFLKKETCKRCHGEKLIEASRLVHIEQSRYPEVLNLSVKELKQWCHAVYFRLSEDKQSKTKTIFVELLHKLKRLEDVGLSYLGLDRSVTTLSGGELQRLKIASQFGSGLSNILYIMDEPSKGLHPRDYKFLIESIQALKASGNTVIVVEHKKAFVDMADYIVEIGPKAGHYGGKLLKSEVQSHKVERLSDTLENAFDFKLERTETCIDMDIDAIGWIEMTGAKTHNLKSVDLKIPKSKMTSVIGVSGSGKSSLVSKTLYPALSQKLGIVDVEQGYFDHLKGVESIETVVLMNQQAIGKNSRSTPATYTGVFDLIRSLYSKLDRAKEMKLTKEHFSFNSSKGQCKNCKGIGEIITPMHFMPDICTVCESCHGKRYKAEILDVLYKGYSIADVLEMEIGEAKALFKESAQIYNILEMLDRVGLGYLKLGQSASTLSGGESQRIRLAKTLYEDRLSSTLYILDEPTTGLQDTDIKRLLPIFKEMTDQGATIITIEHNPLLIVASDYVIELGPEGGHNGGYILREGWLIQ